MNKRKSNNLSPIEIEKELKKNTVLPYDNESNTPIGPDGKSRNIFQSNIATKDLTHLENFDIYGMNLDDKKSINTHGINTNTYNSKL